MRAMRPAHVPTRRTPAWRRVRGIAGRRARTGPASATSPSSRRSLAAPCSARAMPRPCQSSSSTYAPPKRRASRISTSLPSVAATASAGSRPRPLRARGSGRSRRRDDAAPLGRPCRLGRSYGSPWRPASPSPGGARCGRVGGRRRPSRPCSSGGSHAATRLPDHHNYEVKSSIHVPTPFGASGQPSSHLPAPTDR